MRPGLASQVTPRPPLAFRPAASAPPSRLALSAALLSALALAACGGTAETRDPEPGLGDGPGMGDEPADRPSRGGRRPDPNALIVRFEEAGGAGPATSVLQVSVATGGLDLRSGLSEPRRLRVQPGEVAQLAELVGGPSFAALRSRYGATVPDPGEEPPETYRVVVTRGAEERSVLTEENAENQPAVLRQAIGELLRLRRLVEQLGS